MKLSKDKIIEVAMAFNQSCSFDEFLVKLDLCNVSLNDFEQDYFELIKLHPAFKDFMTCGGKINTFNSRLYMTLDPRKIMLDTKRLMSDRFTLPLWIERDKYETVSMMMPNDRKLEQSYSPKIMQDLANMGVDANKEMAQMLLYELGHI